MRNRTRTARIATRARQRLGLLRGLTCGEGCEVAWQVTIEGTGVVLGRHVRIRPGVHTKGPEVFIGDRVFINRGCTSTITSASTAMFRSDPTPD